MPVVWDLVSCRLLLYVCLINLIPYTMDDKQQMAATLADARAELDRVEKTSDQFVLVTDVKEEDAHNLFMAADDMVLAQAALSIFSKLEPETKVFVFQKQLKELSK